MDQFIFILSAVRQQWSAIWLHEAVQTIGGNDGPVAGLESGISAVGPRVFPTNSLFLRLAICQQVCNTLHSAEVHSTNARYDNKLKTDRISDHSFPVCGPHCWSSGTEIGSHPHKAGEFNTKMSIAINELATRLADMTRGLRATYLLLEKLDQDIHALKSQAR